MIKLTSLRLNQQVTDILNNHKKYYLKLDTLRVYFRSKTDVMNKVIQYLVENGILVEDENFE